MFMFSSCLDEYQKLNTDQEQLGVADPLAAFTGATLNYNNCSRGHLTGLYGGSMIHMQYLVSDGGASTGNYNNMDDENTRTAPSNQSYSFFYTANGDGYGAFGLRLDNLINTLIPSHDTPDKYNDVKAIAQILLNHQQWQILDTYGAAPITEAFRVAQGIRTPQYDLYQKSINGEPMYKVLDAEVKAAVNALKSSNSDQINLGTNDFFYGGDIEKWIKFGNTLRVKMAQRVELADKSFYESVIGEVLASASNVIDSHEASCLYWHPNNYNDNVDDIQNITSRYVASAAFVNYLKAYNDPRLPILIRRNGFGLGNNNKDNDDWFEIFAEQNPGWETEYARFVDRYSGMSANPDNAADEFERSEYLTRPYINESGVEAVMDIRMHSQVEGRFFVKNGGDYGNNNMPNREIESEEYKFDKQTIKTFTPLITYPETCFMLAEIAVKKGSAVAGKDATAWMKEGIKASMEQYRSWAETARVLAQTEPNSDLYAPITDEAIAAYLAQPEFQEASLEKIISQQWIELFRNPMEMWAVWKRTGLPAFQSGVPTPADGVAFFEAIEGEGTFEIPRRNALGTPNTLNIENYNAAVQALISDAKYGDETKDTDGRIWWDVYGL